MTNHSIVSTKINTPRLRADAVMRPRLTEILNEGLTRPSALTLVCASAGYGKTTLVISWLRNVERRHAWLSLEAEDDNLPRFMTYLLSALQKIHPSIGKSAKQILESFRTDSLPTDAIIASLIHDLSKSVEPVILVLEDYHLIESSPVHAFVESLIEHAHPHIHFVITARADPPLPLGKWRARNQLTEIRVADLQFTLSEATEFIQRVLRLALSEQEIHYLEERTEGWAAGLQLAAVSIRSGRNKSEPWAIEGGQRDIADYWMTEVLRQLPRERREFLLQTSLVSQLSAPLCNVLTGRNDSQLVLEALEADNLFTLALDDAREWFRYHHLFAEFLRKRLLSEYSESFVHGAHQRASHWLAENGFSITAIDHALAAKDYEYAAQLIGPQSAQWMRRGETSPILKYLDQLPRELVWDRWALCLWYGWSYAVTGDLNAARHWTNRLEALITPPIQETAIEKGVPVLPGLKHAYVQVLAIRSLIARSQRDFVHAIALGEQALQLVPQNSLNLKSIVSALLSSATLAAGQFDHTESILHSARSVAYRVSNPYIVFMMLLNESALATMRGQLHRAHELNMEALQLAQVEAMERLMFLLQFRLARIYYFWNRLSQARQYVIEAIKHANVSEYLETTVQGYITLARIQNAEGYYTDALQTLTDAEAIALQHHEMEPAERVKGVRAQLQLLAGEYEAAGRWVKSSGWELFDPSRSGPSFNDESFFPFCHYLIASGQPREWQRSERLLDWRLKDSSRQMWDGAIIKIRLLQASLHHAQNHPDSAMSALLQALEVAVPENFVRPFLDEGQLLSPLLRRVPHKHAVRDFSETILATVSNVPRTHPLFEPLTEQEMNILQLMAQGHTNPQIAHTRILAVSTVRWYARQIYRKLGVHNRTQAAAQARKLNLL
jgi:LuxR family maltose regulon positive regulatory protein